MMCKRLYNRIENMMCQLLIGFWTDKSCLLSSDSSPFLIHRESVVWNQGCPKKFYHVDDEGATPQLLPYLTSFPLSPLPHLLWMDRHRISQSLLFKSSCEKILEPLSNAIFTGGDQMIDLCFLERDQREMGEFWLTLQAKGWLAPAVSYDIVADVAVP